MFSYPREGSPSLGVKITRRAVAPHPGRQQVPRAEQHEREYDSDHNRDRQVDHDADHEQHGAEDGDGQEDETDRSQPGRE